MAQKKNYALRIDPKLYAAIERWAEDEMRSVNAHIEFILREAVRKAGRFKDESNEKTYAKGGKTGNTSN
jgi:hypothetical protein